MTATEMPGPVDFADVIVGVRYGLAFDAEGRPRSVKKQTSECRQILERISSLARLGYRRR